MNKEIRKILIDRETTQVQAARELGMSRQNLHRILSKKARRSPQTLRVAEYFGIPEGLLLSDNGDENQQSCQH